MGSPATFEGKLPAPSETLIKAGWCLVGEWFLYESSSNCTSQMGASNTPELPSDGYTVQVQSVND